MWAHAEDLDTLEFTLMQVITYIAGPVRILTVFMPLVWLIQYNPQDVSTDFTDEVRVSGFKGVWPSLRCWTDHCTL